jgi:hypothetical protein
MSGNFGYGILDSESPNESYLLSPLAKLMLTKPVLAHESIVDHFNEISRWISYRLSTASAEIRNGYWVNWRRLAKE